MSEPWLNELGESIVELEARNIVELNLGRTGSNHSGVRDPKFINKSRQFNNNMRARKVQSCI